MPIPTAAPPTDSLYGRALAILNELRGGRLNDDETYPPRLVADWIRSAWSALVEASLASGEGVDPQLLVSLTLTLTRRPEDPLVRGEAPLIPLASLLGRPWIEKVETAGGMVCTPAWNAPEARQLAVPRPYGKSAPPPAWFVEPAGRGRARLVVMLPARHATLPAVVATVLPARLDVDETGVPLSEWASCPLLSGSRWEAVRAYVMAKHGPVVSGTGGALDQKNDGAPTPA